MNKLYFACSLIATLLLIALSIWAPASPIMWLASTSASFTALRVVLAIFLAILLFTNPPRQIAFRLLLGIASATLIAWACVAAWNGQMQIIDSFMILQAGISFGISALEPNPEDLLERSRYIFPAKAVHNR